MIKITKNDAPTLTALVDLMNDATNKCIAAADDTDALRIDEVYDITSLPTYGGPEPLNTEGIYSWDRDNVLYGDGNAPSVWHLGDRDEQ